MIGGGDTNGTVLSLPTVPKTLLLFFRLNVPSFSFDTLRYAVLLSECELFFKPETVVNLTKCLLAMRPMSAIF